MKRFTKIFTSTVLFLAIAVGPAHGQGGDPPPVDWVNPFSWFFETPPDWVTGITLAIIGLVGAALIVYSSIGGAIPGTAGSATIKRDLKRVEEFKRRLVELSADPVGNQAAIESLKGILAEIRGPLDKERFLNYTLAGGFYLFLGAFFASMLAQDLFQALAIGAGWTSLIGVFGLKKEFHDLEAEREKAGEKLKHLLEPKIQQGVWNQTEAEEVRILIKETTI